MDPRDLCELLYRHRYRIGHETLLQEDVEILLTREGIPFKREFVLGPADRVDFLVDQKIGLELKIKMSARHIFRQLERYAAHDRIDALVLMTSATRGVPGQIRGKPCFVVNLGRQGF